MNQRKIHFLIAFVCVLSTGCSPRDFLTRRLAADLIEGSSGFKAPQQFFLRTGMITNKDYVSPEYLVLQHRGWITGVNVPCTANVGPAPCWDVALTPIGVETFRGLIPSDMSSKQYFPIDIARRQLLSTTGIVRNGNLADVDFTWKWMPLNEVGAALVDGGVNFRSTVGFKHYDDGWRLVEGSGGKSGQGLDDALRDAQPAP
jgi:hypothetical protein